MLLYGGAFFCPIMKNIQKKIKNGYEINSVELYKNTFSDYRKMFFTTALSLFLIFIVLMTFYMMIITYYFGDPIKASEKIAQFDFLKLTQEELLIYIGSNAILVSIFSIFTAGFIALAHEVHQNHLPKLGTVFQYFLKKKGLYVFIYALIYQSLTGLISFYLQAADLTLVSLFLTIILHTLTIFVIPLIIFNPLSITKAVKYSFQIVNQQPLRILSLFLFFGICSMGGFFLFIIGILLSLPILYAFIYNLYVEVIGKD